MTNDIIYHVSLLDKYIVTDGAVIPGIFSSKQEHNQASQSPEKSWKADNRLARTVIVSHYLDTVSHSLVPARKAYRSTITFNPALANSQIWRIQPDICTYFSTKQPSTVVNANDIQYHGFTINGTKAG
jgi:hypothetical protein